ncbi:hypothetical protein [Modicisalibacter sp. MOD 31.J]|uniref:hypothetical protein n=1 Tax=Modicisalibacter sp. MOD 31.J TaxID=2831897 RepID=UPI001CCFB1C0|nr:hypothetical protein [Modicisalibacter sp. MOD 31.J]MBZ9574600.1 hypothetical protein [Modicisalibacter sp. MOD 31.J]
MRHNDHWFARHFATDDFTTREHVQKTLIPRWQAAIAENEQAAAYLRKVGRDETDPLLATVVAETATLQGNIEAATKRLTETERAAQ